MRFFKMAGMLLLFVCGLFASALLVRFEKKRARQAEGFLSLLRFIRMQIDCFSAPIGRILSKIDEKTRKDCELPENAPDFPRLLEGTSLFVPPEMQTLLEQFSKDLGKGYREDQLRTCDYYIAQLRLHCEKIRAELSKRIRLWLLLPPILTAALILLLI